MNRQKWEIPFSEPEIADELLSAGITPLLSCVLTSRGIKTAEEAEKFLGNEKVLGDPLNMKDMEKARDRLLLAIADGENVAVYGDYDVDGITASCLLSSYLESKGLNCITHIPDREGEGYGLNIDALDKFKESGVSLVITVDCGITAVEEAEHAKAIGIDLIITDHHVCPTGALPDAVAVVDYKRSDDEYEYKILAGVGVAFKLVCACEGSDETILNEYSDLVAIGTVADVMPLTGENRYLVKRGLNHIRTKPRAGINALMSELPSSISDFSENSISFSLAPRLNAAGRMGQAITAAKLIATEDNDTAQLLAQELNDLNDLRKLHEKNIWKDAIGKLKDTNPDSPIVLSDYGWHPGVIGIVASRLSEKFKLPAIIICLKEDSEVAKGSCRSYGSFNLHEALNYCSENLKSFGGHALAAGLSIEKDKIDAFRDTLSHYYKEVSQESPPGVECDFLIMDENLLNEENVSDLAQLSPFGAENEKPRFCMYGVRADNINKVGPEGKHIKLRVKLGNKEYDCIYFSPSQELNKIICAMKPGDTVDIVFNPQINEFRGNKNVQLSIQELRPHDSLELCTEIINAFEGCAWTAIRYKPAREDFITAWNRIKQPGYKLEDSIEKIISNTPEKLTPETYCLCLRAFLETGLLKPGAEGSVQGARAYKPDGKVNLEETYTIRSLNSYGR